jgi:hypothetical protein
MDNMDELLWLMDLQKALKPVKYDRLNLYELDLLRIEVERRLNKMKNKKL